LKLLEKPTVVRDVVFHVFPLLFHSFQRSIAVLMSAS
jgi:hypothetical protein